MNNNRILLFILVMIATFASHVSHAQWDVHNGGAMNTTNGISRWGNVGIGMTASYIPGYPLHIITSDNTGIKLVNTVGGSGSNIGVDFITYNPGSSNDHRTARISVIDGGSYNGSLVFYTRGTNVSGGNNITERMRIFHDGNVGIGTPSPLKLLHLKGASGTPVPVLLLDAHVNTSPGIEFKHNNVLTHDITYSSTTNQLKVGPNNSSHKSIFFRTPGTGSIIFSNNPNFAVTGNNGLTGTYLFDAQVSATSLMVAPAGASGSYPTIQGGALFNVQGSSYLNGLFQINNSADLDPVSVTGNGITMGSSTNTITGPPAIGPYSWIQTDKLRPLALNPIPDGNPTNTSYVAIGFIPGTYNVPLNYKLAVKGKIICEELKVKYAGIWSDYVFEKDYKLRALKEVENYITENKHLPDVPSAGEIKEKGFETGEMDATLLRKIEELTLYVIEINKQVESLKASNEALKKDNELLKQNISK